MEIHIKRMLELIEYTRSNSEFEPYGSSIYDAGGNLLASATGDKLSPINHAEVKAINECARIYPDINWNMLTLYSTGEPCCMCSAACCWANLKEVIFGTNIPFMIDLWGIESQARAHEIIELHPKQPKLIADVAQQECNELFLECEIKFAKIWNEKRWALKS